LSALSTRATHDAQVMPVTGKEREGMEEKIEEVKGEELKIED
jgi:hypothetical protein